MNSRVNITPFFWGKLLIPNLGFKPLRLIAFITVSPMMPPIMPPIACNPAQPTTPPHWVKAGGDINIEPIIKPAKAAENTEIMNKMIEPKILFLNIRLYPLKNTRMSKVIEATKKPKN